MSVVETCRCCSSLVACEQGICKVCARTYGPRVARLLGRCQADPQFASNTLARLPEPARSRFAAALSAKCLKTARPLSGPGLRSARPRLEEKKRVSA
jgi:hypothetical protein